MFQLLHETTAWVGIPWLSWGEPQDSTLDKASLDWHAVHVIWQKQGGYLHSVPQIEEFL